MNREGKDIKERERRDRTKIGVDRRIPRDKKP